MTFSKFAAVCTLSTALAVSSTAHAGNLAAPLMEDEVVMAPEVIAEETAGTSGFIIPLVILAILAAVLLIDGGASDSMMGGLS